MAHVWIWRVLLTLSALLLVSSIINLVPLILKHSTCLHRTNSNTSSDRKLSHKRHDADLGSSSVGALKSVNMDPTTIAMQSDILHKIREVESSVLFYSPDSRPLVVAKDISLGRYYAQRDLQGWTIAYKNFSFEVVEQSFRSPVKLSELSVFLCLGIHTQDKHCIKPSSYRTFMQSQKVNQIHGLRDTLWRKDAFCYTMREALGSYKGRRNFTFPCWVLPKDKEALEVEMSKRKMDWIVKPSGKGEGHGIFVVNTFEELSLQNTDGFVVQSFLKDPYLVHGRKFDFRTYVLVTSVVPLRAYIYREGLVRFASSKYDRNATKGGKEQQFLTNTSVGKKYTQLSNLTWTFQKLKQYFTKCGIDAEKVFESVNEAIVRTLLAAEYRFLRDFHLYLGGYDCQNCFQLLGVDVILDSKLNPIVIEVNGLPSMQLSHDLGVPPNPANPYTATKFGLMHDMLQILYKPTSVAAELAQDLQRMHVGVTPGPLCSKDHHTFCVDYKELQKLLEFNREFVNRGGYQRIYPSAAGQKYSRLILHLHNLIRRKFDSVPVRTLWHMHHLYTALEKLYMNKSYQ